MVYPVDQKTARFNTNKHDAFGVDTGGRKLPHTGIDFAGSGPIFSVYGGMVIWSGFDKEAGWSIVIRENDGRRRGYAHMLSKPNYVVGQTVPKGYQIGTIGASGTGAKGAHLHMWEALTDAAAIRILTGYIDYKGSKTTKQWADGMGLVDPMPAIEASLRGTEDKPAPTPTPEKAEDEIELIIWMAGKNPGHGVLETPNAFSTISSAEAKRNLLANGAKEIWIDEVMLKGLIDDSRGAYDVRK